MPPRKNYILNSEKTKNLGQSTGDIFLAGSIWYNQNELFCPNLFGFYI